MYTKRLIPPNSFPTGRLSPIGPSADRRGEHATASTALANSICFTPQEQTFLVVSPKVWL